MLNFWIPGYRDMSPTEDHQINHANYRTHAKIIDSSLEFKYPGTKKLTDIKISQISKVSN